MSAGRHVLCNSRSTVAIAEGVNGLLRRSNEMRVVCAFSSFAESRRSGRTAGNGDFCGEETFVATDDGFGNGLDNDVRKRESSTRVVMMACMRIESVIA